MLMAYCNAREYGLHKALESSSLLDMDCGVLFAGKEGY